MLVWSSSSLRVMAVRRQVHRDPVDRGGEVGPVIEIESAQEELIRLSSSAVLRRDQPRHRLENLARPRERPTGELLEADRALRGGLGHPDEAIRAAPDHDLLDGSLLLAGNGARRQQSDRQRNEPGDVRLHAGPQESRGAGSRGCRTSSTADQPCEVAAFTPAATSWIVTRKRDRTMTSPGRGYSVTKRVSCLLPTSCPALDTDTVASQVPPMLSRAVPA
jgi:hypothetical protein